MATSLKNTNCFDNNQSTTSKGRCRKKSTHKNDRDTIRLRRKQKIQLEKKQRMDKKKINKQINAQFKTDKQVHKKLLKDWNNYKIKHLPTKAGRIFMRRCI